MELLTEAPRPSAFVPLSEHQSTTPVSFHSGPAVLHYYSDRCQVIVLEEELQNAPVLLNLVTKASAPAHSNERESADDANGHNPAQKTLEEIDIWVTSDKLLLYSNPHEIGVSIPYPTISLHAIQSLPAPAATEPQSQGLYMQLIPSSPSQDDDEPPDTISMTIIPTASAPPAPAAPTSSQDDAVETEDKPEQTPVMALFTALSDCSNLHPDPIDPDEDDESRLMQAGLALPGTSDGSLPPPMPGSGGWITAENMHEFIDEDGNFIEDDDQMDVVGETTEELGPGAGTVRSHPDSNNDASEDSKWQRTS